MLITKLVKLFVATGLITLAVPGQAGLVLGHEDALAPSVSRSGDTFRAEDQTTVGECSLQNPIVDDVAFSLLHEAYRSCLSAGFKHCRVTEKKTSIDDGVCRVQVAVNGVERR